jgi:hypothetical protein
VVNSRMAYCCDRVTDVRCVSKQTKWKRVPARAVACRSLENYIHIHMYGMELKHWGQNHTCETHPRKSFADLSSDVDIAAQQTAAEISVIVLMASAYNIAPSGKERLEEYVVKGVASGSLDDGRVRVVSLACGHGVRGRDVVRLG